MKNESLITKNSVSSSIFTNEYLYSYYYKVNNFRNSDANLYIDGLNKAIPLMNKKDIDDFNIEEILEIRIMRELPKEKLYLLRQLYKKSGYALSLH